MWKNFVTACVSVSVSVVAVSVVAVCVRVWVWEGGESNRSTVNIGNHYHLAIEWNCQSYQPSMDPWNSS